MKIFTTTDWDMLYRVSRFAAHVEGLNYTADEFFKYLIDGAEAHKIEVIVSVEGDKMLGFGVYSIHENLISGKRQAFIDLTWIDPAAPKDTGPLMLEKVEDFARKHGLDEIGCFSRKREKGMWAKYGFTIEYTIYKKTVEGGNNGSV